MKQIVTLTNGKRVANFSSPHPFTFTDGTILPAVSDKESERLKVTFIEEFINRTGDIKLSFKLSEEILTDIGYWNNQHDLNHIDVVYCPLPMMTALKDWGVFNLELTPFRSIRIEDRINKLVSIDKQCI